MILVIGGIKGGSGKTTLATNLTVLLSERGNKVLLVDCDQQKSASDWSEQRTASDFDSKFTTVQLSGTAIHSQLVKMQKDYDYIIVDVGGRDSASQRSALMAADIFLVPFKPRSFDIWTLSAVKSLVLEAISYGASFETYAVINQADARGKDNQEAIEILTNSDINFLDCIIGNRKSFSNAASLGLGVTESINSDKKAIQEIKVLWNHIESKLKQHQKHITTTSKSYGIESENRKKAVRRKG